MHHPLVAAGALWWGLLALTVHLDTSALTVGLLPTLAVIVNYYMAKRARRQIAAEASAAAAENAVKVGEVHELVNHQRDELKAEILTLRTEVDSLHAQLALSTPPKAAA